MLKLMMVELKKYLFNFYSYIMKIIFLILLFFLIFKSKNKENFNHLKKSKKVLITFAGGGKKYHEAARRLINQGKSTGYFDETILYTDKDLKNKFVSFWNQHKKFILNNKRGFGYWIWKSFIIKKTMESMNNGDILMYLDCGCEIGGKKASLIPNFFEYVKKDKIIGTETQIERNWDKMDLIVHLNMENHELLKTPQRQGGAVLYYVCKDTRKFINLWYNLCCNYHLIDDSESVIPNKDYFREHRHDQSIFSLLTKKNNLFSKKSLRDCVYINRNKSGTSKI